MLQHRPVFFMQDIHAQLHRQVWPDSQNVTIKGHMVKLTERDAIRYDRLPSRIPIWENVSSFQKFLVPQPADCTAFSIRPKHPLPKALLMKPLSGYHSDIRTTSFGEPILAGAGRRRY